MCLLKELLRMALTDNIKQLPETLESSEFHFLHILGQISKTVQNWLFDDQDPELDIHIKKRLLWLKFIFPCRKI